jgi:hypothetical protein
MAEVVGLAASILQIAGAGAKLSSALYHFTTSAVRADQDIADIASDVELTSNALESVGKVFETEDAKSIVSKKAIQDANNIIKRCEAVFKDIAELVDKRRKNSKDGKKSLSVMGKLSWPMKEQRVELHRRRLESLKNSLMLLLHVLQLAQGQARGYAGTLKSNVEIALTGVIDNWKRTKSNRSAKRFENFTSDNRILSRTCKHSKSNSARLYSMTR